MEPTVYTPVSARANLRRSIIVAVGLAVAGIAVTAALGHPLMGVFGALGLALGAVNNRMLQESVLRYAATVSGIATDHPVTKKKFRGGIALRLGGITVLAIGLALAVRPDGLGTFVGLAVFQILMLVGAAVPVFRSLRPTA